jgi:glutaconate CoA-transferase subunit B
MTRLQPDATIEQARSATGWDLAISADVEEITSPSDDELQILRRLRHRDQSTS